MERLGGPSRPELLDKLTVGRLTWLPAIGVGYYPVTAGAAPYDRAYFERFGRQADSQIGRALMNARVDLVADYHAGELVDVGIGSGAFVELRNSGGRFPPNTFGFDVNPCGLAWLKDRQLYADPYVRRVRAVSFWDVLEHIPDFPKILANVTDWVFISIPIFTDANHVLRSRHFRPTEHVWYFTAEGLINVMAQLGFRHVYQDNVETRLGREDIGSFVFRRAK